MLMIKDKRILFLCLGLSLSIFLLNDEEIDQDHLNSKQQGTSHLDQIPTKSILKQKKGPLNKAPEFIGYVNIPSPDWQKKLESSLKEQGGSYIKEIIIKKEKSFVWNRDDNPLHVESVMVTLINQEKSESSFRAIVDSQTGKILESWDRTIVEPSHANNSDRFKLDSQQTN
jgi:hypothetical protein